ncbi:GGDEF domain-containing protein [Pseudomonas sp. REB1044]|uniref:GGDEF domain-containing protein n=1 Tax=Pseudomonas sp. REB1044 TaxID=2675224 RepID=UPI00315CC20A
MPRNLESLSPTPSASARHEQRIRLLLRQGIIAAQLLVIFTWVLVHVLLLERLSRPGAWVTLAALSGLFLIQTFTVSQRVWRFSGLLFVLAAVSGFRLIFEEYPLLYERYALPLTVMAVVGASLLIRGPMDYLVVASLTWLLVWPFTGSAYDSARWSYLALFVIFSIGLGWINSRTYLRALQVTLDVEQHYRTLSETDHLTGLLNRRALMERFERFVASHPAGYFMMIDVDDFKRVNDSLGHAAGDQVLCLLARRLKAKAGADYVGRLGGEEFGIILNTEDASRAVAWAESLLQEVRQSRDAPAPFTFSAGLVPFVHGQALSDILIHADRNLYRAKRAGKDRVHLGSPTGLPV